VLPSEDLLFLHAALNFKHLGLIKKRARLDKVALSLLTNADTAEFSPGRRVYYIFETDCIMLTQDEKA